MGNGAILKIKRVVDTNKLVSGSLKYNYQGFLVKFSITSIEKKYVHVKLEDFNVLDFYDENNLPSAGYFLESEFFKYLGGSITIGELNSFMLLEDKLKLIELIEDEIIEVYRLRIDFPYDYFYKLEKAAFIFKKDIDLIDVNGLIIIPTNSINTIQNVNFDINNDKGKQFYLSRKILIDDFLPDKKSTASYQLTLIGIYINLINEDIFSAFINGTNNYSIYVDLQNIYWISNQDTFINPTLEYLAEFLNNLKLYYKAAYPNKLKIQNAVGIEKLYWLAVSLSSNALTNLPNADKLDLIKYLIKSKLSNNVERLTDEQLVIKLVVSFSETSNFEINEFLSNFIRIDNENNSQSTLYEILYNKMSTSTNLKSGLIALSNSWFGSSYKPTTTKSDFVQAVYRLWYFSDYNPYNFDGSLKPNTLGFRTFNNSLSSFASIDINSYRYKYTHHTAYVKEFSDDINDHYIRYKELHPQAAPMVIPYESDKLFGIFFDNFNFKIDGTKIKFYQSLKVGGGNNQYSGYTDASILFGTYKIFQPVTLLNANVETKSSISTVYGDDILVNGQNINSFIPAFVLAHIDAEGDSSDAETMIGYTVDVATTFTGVGALAKMKHLRWASSGIVAAGDTALFSMNGLRIVVGGVEFTSGVLGFLANFVECGPNDDFCNGMKVFIMTLQIASLSVNAADGLASFAMKLQAKRVVKAAGGGATETEIIANVKSRLQELYPNESDTILTEVASKIGQTSGMLFSVLLPVPQIINLVKKAIERSKSFLRNPLYSDAVMTSFINYCRNDLKILDDQMIEDLLLIANRKKADKFINPTTLTKQTNYYINEVLKRGFSAGFSSKINYRNFCISAKNNFINTLGDLDEDFLQFEDAFEFYVKGSSVRSPRTVADVNLNNVELPAADRFARDIDIDIILPPRQYEKFCNVMTLYLKKLLKEEKIDKNLFVYLIKEKNYLNPNGDMLLYGTLFKELKVVNIDFVTNFRNSCSQFTEFPSGDINFAVVKQKGLYDLKPKLKFDN